MSLKSMLDSAYKDFEMGKKDIDFSYTMSKSGLSIEGFNIHDPYKWDDKKEPVYFSYNNETKRMHVSNLSSSDLRDETLLKFLGIDPEGFV